MPPELTRALALTLLWALACAGPGSSTARFYRSELPEVREPYCAWYGSEQAGVLYFGESAFWGTYRESQDDPAADLQEAGPQRIGRFDLGAERFLPALRVGGNQSRSGVWDVLALPEGRVYYTTFFEDSGYVDLATTAVHSFEKTAAGLNELAPGPDGTILASRYGTPGSVVVLEPDGRVRDEFPLDAPQGYRVAPKTVAYDPSRREIWVTTDLLPLGPDPIRHDARILDLGGRELLRVERPEVQFVAFAADGTGYWAERSANQLFLRVAGPGLGPTLEAGRRILLDGSFAADLDFAQDLQIAADGRVVVTRWSGTVHVLSPDGSLRSVRLPRPKPGGLYYTAVLAGDRLCATYCADVAVVCRPAP